MHFFVTLNYFFFLMIRRPPRSTRTDTLFPYTTLFRSLSTRAERDGEDWLITGNKYWCTNADGADAILVLARTEPVDAAKPHKGISAFLVEKPRGSLPNNCAGAPIPKIGYFGWKTWELAFDKCRVPHANMVSKTEKVGKECVSTCKSRGGPVN